MAINADQLAQAAILFGAFTNRVPGHVRDKVQVDYRREGNSFILFEFRPRLMKPEEWTETPIAKFTYIQSRDRWKLYWMKSDFRWHKYGNLPEADTLSDLCKEVHQDPWCCFWG